MRRSLTIGSLFSGIGGLELGLEWAGLGPVVWQCERDAFCLSVLAKHWPHATRYTDVRSVDASAPRVDVLCGGFPCQDISNAGKRAGIDGDRSGLWSEFARVIGLLRPRFVVVENVSALLGRGMDRVLGDLAALGYDAEWSALRASDVGAPHRRERIFIVAHAHNSGDDQREGKDGSIHFGSESRGAIVRLGGRSAAMAHGDGAASGGVGHRGEVGYDAGGCSAGALGDSAQPGQPGPHDGRDSGRRGAAEPTGAVGDPIGSGLEERGGERGYEGAQRTSAQRTGPLADDDAGGRDTSQRDLREGQCDADGSSEDLADAEGVRHRRSSLAGSDRGREGQGVEAPRRRTCGTSEPERQGGVDGSTQPGLGRAAHGVPARVDRWPAGPAEEQQPWEAARVVSGRTVNRPARLRALGNAVVPQCGEVAGRVLLALAEGSK